MKKGRIEIHKTYLTPQGLLLTTALGEAEALAARVPPNPSIADLSVGSCQSGKTTR